MFEASEGITRAVDAVYALTLSLKRGEILRHGSIRGVLGMAPHVGCWDHVVRRVVDRVLDARGIQMWPEHTVGYKMMTVQEQLDVPRRRMKRAVRQMVKGRISQEKFLDADLTDYQQMVRSRNVEALSDAEVEMRRRVREHRIMSKPTHVGPDQQSGTP